MIDYYIKYDRYAPDLSNNEFLKAYGTAGNKENTNWLAATNLLKIIEGD